MIIVAYQLFRVQSAAYKTSLTALLQPDFDNQMK